MKNFCYLILFLLMNASLQLSDGQARYEPQAKLGGNVLDRRVEGDPLESMTTTGGISQSLYRTGVPGGIASVSDCRDVTPSQQWIPAGFTLRDTLDWIVREDRRYHWFLDDGVVNVLPAEGEPKLLKVRITRLEIPKMTSVHMALSALTALAEVKEAIVKLRLEHGLHAVVRPVPLRPIESGPAVHCENVSVREALNAIARIHGQAVWLYDERTCDGRVEFTIDFVVV